MLRVAAGNFTRRDAFRKAIHIEKQKCFSTTPIRSHQNKANEVRLGAISAELNSARYPSPVGISFSTSSASMDSSARRYYSSSNEKHEFIQGMMFPNRLSVISSPHNVHLLRQIHEIPFLPMQTRYIRTLRRPSNKKAKGTNGSTKRPLKKKTKLARKRLTYSNRRAMTGRRRKDKKLTPLQKRVKEERRKTMAAAGESRSWKRVGDIAGASSALIEKYAVPPIQTIRNLATVPAISKGDLLSVLAVLSLLSTILITPFAARYVWKSESEDYEDLEWDDPVAQTEKNFRHHVSEDLGESLRVYLLDKLKESRERRSSHEGKATGEDDLTAESPPIQERRKKVPRTIRNTESVVTEILESEVLANAVTSFIAQIIESQRVSDALQGVLRRLWRDLINDPETTAQVVELLHNGIQNKEIKKSVRNLVIELINDKEVYNELQQLLIRLGNEQKVLAATQGLLTESAHKALNDPEILDHSMAFATDVVGDDVVQRTSGEALRNTVSYAVRPGFSAFMALVGLALIIFSFSALGNAKTTAQEAELVDKAFSSMARSLQDSTVSGVSTVMSLPGRILSSCVALIVGIAKAPFQLVSAAASALSRVGKAASRSISGAIASIIAFPVVLLEGVWSSIVSVGQSLTHELSNVFGGLISAVSDSFVGSAIRSVVEVVSVAVSAVSSAASACGQALSEGVEGVGNILASVATSISGLGQAVSAFSSSFFKAVSENWQVFANAVGKEFHHVSALAGQVLTQSRDAVGAIAKSLGLTEETVEKVVATASAVVNASIDALSSLIMRLLGRNRKPDSI